MAMHISSTQFMLVVSLISYSRAANSLISRVCQLSTTTTRSNASLVQQSFNTVLKLR
jgi:hypothetical protein